MDFLRLDAQKGPIRDFTVCREAGRTAPPLKRRLPPHTIWTHRPTPVSAPHKLDLQPHF